MVKVICCVLALVLGASLPAKADNAFYSICKITTNAATVCNSMGGGAAGSLVGIYNNSLAAQLGTLICYDNASAASGTVAAQFGPLGLMQMVTWPPPGRAVTNGITCQASLTPSGTIEVYVR